MTKSQTARPFQSYTSRITCPLMGDRKEIEMLKKNVGSADRMIRIVLGLALVAGFFMTSGSYSWLYLVGAAVALGTAAMNSCALYTILGVNTCKTK